jgi:CRP-like cAMP-binding protein
MADKAKSGLPCEFPAGKLLFTEKSKGDCFFIITEGKVSVFKTKDNLEIPLAVIGKGESVGEFSVIDGKNRSASARALTNVKAVQFTKHMLDQEMNKLPNWVKTIVTKLIERTRKTNEILKRNSTVDETVLAEIEHAEYEHNEELAKGSCSNQSEDPDSTDTSDSSDS